MNLKLRKKDNIERIESTSNSIHNVTLLLKVLNTLISKGVSIPTDLERKEGLLKDLQRLEIEASVWEEESKAIAEEEAKLSPPQS